MIRFNRLITLTCITFLMVSMHSYAATSLYLPVSQSPIIERKIDTLLLMANMTNVKKPIAINKLKLAFNSICTDATNTNTHTTALCTDIQTYLINYNKKYSIIYGSLALNSSDRKNQSLANKRGLMYENRFFAHIRGHAQINDYLTFTAGIQGSDSSVYLEDTYLSFGTDWAQVDVGTKPHWFSPFKHSAMLISTHAQTIPTISISNNQPLSFLNINYELFVGKLSESDKIRYQNDYITDKPIITGVHLEFSPFPGFSLAVNRLLQSGGGERNENGLDDLLKAFFNPSGADNTSDDLSFDEQFGNQNASITSQFTFPGPRPFSIYLEYAGEDTSRGSNWRLGNSALSAGVFIPFLTPSISLTYEWSEWQNAWYSHSVYQDGMINKDNILGHWAAEYRATDGYYNDNSIGGIHNFVELNWRVTKKDNLTFQLSHTSNENYGSIDYENAYKGQIQWQTYYDAWPITIELESGQDAFGQSYYRITTEIGL